MAYVTPGTVAAGDVATAAAWNVITNDIINLRAMTNVVQHAFSATAQVTLTTANTFYDTGLTINFTPTDSSFKALIHGYIQLQANTSAGPLSIRIMRNSTAIGIGDAASSRTRASVVQGVAASTSNEVTNPFPFTFLDTHGLSSTITYKIQAACRTAGVTLDVNRTEAAADAASQHFGASCMIVQEIPV